MRSLYVQSATQLGGRGRNGLDLSPFAISSNVGFSNFSTPSNTLPSLGQDLPSNTRLAMPLRPIDDKPQSTAIDFQIILQTEFNGLRNLHIESCVVMLRMVFV